VREAFYPWGGKSISHKEHPMESWWIDFMLSAAGVAVVGLAIILLMVNRYTRGINMD